MITSLGPPILTPEAPTGPERQALPTQGQKVEVQKVEGETFADLLRRVSASEHAAQEAARSYATGETQNLHETMTTLQLADIQFSLLMTVRNKLLEAYREVMRMG